MTSNRESGEGRFDIQLMPKYNSRPGILIELKSKKDLSKEQLDTLAQEALNQINERQYDTEMKTHGITTIFRYGESQEDFMYQVKEKDWKLFRKMLPEWQDKYLERLTKEYIELLSSDRQASDKFWALDKRIKDLESQSTACHAYNDSLSPQCFG